MKVKNLAVTAAVCAALMGTQGVMAEEQPIGAEGMDFAFDNAQVSSVEMSELSGVEMDETEGSKFKPNPINIAGGATSAGTAAVTYQVLSPSPTIGGYLTSVGEGAVAGYASPTTAIESGFGVGAGNAVSDGINYGVGGGNMR